MKFQNAAAFLCISVVFCMTAELPKEMIFKIMWSASAYLIVRLKSWAILSSSVYISRCVKLTAI